MGKTEFLKAFQTANDLQIQQAQTSLSLPEAKNELEETRLIAKMMIESAKIEDALYAAVGVSAEEIELTLIHYLNKKDPEVMQAVIAQQYMMRRFEDEHTH